MSSEIPTLPARTPSRRERAWMNGYVVFAATIMFVLGLWQVVAGLTAVMRDGLYVAPPEYTYSLNLATWGWMIMLLGVLAAGTSVVVLQGHDWGVAAAIVLSILSMIANFLTIPLYPIWSVVIIALATTLIWTLTRPGRKLA